MFASNIGLLNFVAFRQVSWYRYSHSYDTLLASSSDVLWALSGSGLVNVVEKNPHDRLPDIIVTRIRNKIVRSGTLDCIISAIFLSNRFFLVACDFLSSVLGNVLELLVYFIERIWHIGI